MQVSGIHQPADQSPGLLRVPAPPAPPGLVGPDRATDDANGEQQKTDGDGSVAQAVELLAQRQRGAAKGEISGGTIGRQSRLTEAAATDGAAAQFQGLAAIGEEHRHRQKGADQEGGVADHDHADVHDQPAGTQGRDQRSGLLKLVG